MLSTHKGSLQAEHLQLQACLKRQSVIPDKGWRINPFSWFSTPKPVPKPEFWSLPNDMAGIPLQIITSKNYDWLTVLEDVLQVLNVSNTAYHKVKINLLYPG